MTRAPFVLAGTAAGLLGVLGYHTATPGTSTASGSSTAARTSTTTTATTSKRASTASTSSTGTRTATGEDVNYQYGDLQVKVTMSGSRITDISVAQLNVNDPRSESIDQQAVPELRQEAMAAQSAQIDGVSGASYTSQAYEQSLQSALDKLGVTKSTS